MKYFVKSTLTATENNPNFAGETQIWFTGKAGKTDHSPKFIEGWSRKYFAEKYIKDCIEWNEQYELNHPKYWNSTFEVIEAA